jgi:hypothetical protein
MTSIFLLNDLRDLHDRRHDDRCAVLSAMSATPIRCADVATGLVSRSCRGVKVEALQAGRVTGRAGLTDRTAAASQRGRALAVKTPGMRCCDRSPMQHRSRPAPRSRHLG